MSTSEWSAAGLSAALMLGRARRRVLVIDGGEPRNRFAVHMQGVLGHDGIDPRQLVARGRAEAARYGVEFLDGSVEQVEEHSRGLTVSTVVGQVLWCRALIIASGIDDQLPDIPGLAERWGASVLHCPYCHGWEVQDRRLGVLGTGPDGAAPGSTRPAMERSGLFTVGRPRPRDGFLGGLGLDRTETPMGSFLKVDATGRTSHGRIWAAGNVADPSQNVPMAIGSGAMAGGMANVALVTADFDHAVAEPVKGAR